MPGGTTLAQGYVQILPTTKGIKGNLEKEMGGAGDSAGKKSGSMFAGAFSKMAVAGAAAAGAALTKSLLEGANLEQSIGGIQTLFGNYSDTVIKNADNAWKTAGLSANDYMETTTSFAASLLKSLGGDQKAAADVADRAVTDMADNANKMGTNMEDIQNAYQGFAKQNYTMLDNLKLGYGGTQSEMQKLIHDASQMTDIQKELGVAVEDGSMDFDNIVNAISVMQESLGVAGATADEAERTLSGSFAAMKSSAENFLGNLSMRPELVSESLQNLVSATGTFLFKNLFPAVGNVFKSLPTVINMAINQGIPQLLGAGKSILDGIINGMGGNFDFMGKILPMLEGLSKQILNASGGMVDAGLGILTKLAQGIAKGLPKLIKYMPKIIGNLADVINKNAPKIIKGAAKIMLILGKGLIKSIPVLIKNIPQIFKAFLKVWEAVNWLNLGKIAMTGIKKGITSLTKNLSEPVKKAFEKVKSAILAPSNAAKNAIGGIVSAIKGKINFSGIVGKVKSAFAKVKETITSPFTKARDTLKGIINKIKGLFPLKVGKIMSGLKIPKLSLIKGKAPYGFGGKGKMPSVSLKWNAKAADNPYMFTDATIFGAGETTDEIMYGKRKLMDDITAAVRAAGQNGAMAPSGGTVNLIITLDGKTIGQATVDYLNGQTLMFGTSPVLV